MDPLTFKGVNYKKIQLIPITPACRESMKNIELKRADV